MSVFNLLFDLAVLDMHRQTRRIARLQEEGVGLQKESIGLQKQGIDLQKQGLALQKLQAGILTQMSDTLTSMNSEMSEIRKHQAESVAIQQEFMARDKLQAYLEEFVYQGEKLVAECYKEQSQLALSTKYFLLDGVLEYIKKEGIATPMIRGRENKAAFDKVVDGASALKGWLSQHEEVREAIAWSKEEKHRIADFAEEEARRKAKTGLIVIGVFAVLVLVALFACLMFCCLGMRTW